MVMRMPEEILTTITSRSWSGLPRSMSAKASGKVCTRVPHPSGTGPAGRPGCGRSAATTNAIIELADQLVAERIERVVVESTSDYWRPFVYLLEAQGLTVWLVNAREVKQVPGRPEDRQARCGVAGQAQRARHAATVVRAAGRDPQLRDYTRLRSDLTAERTRHKQRLEKLLEDALIKLSTVASDIFGCPARDMLEALIAGDRDPRRWPSSPGAGCGSNMPPWSRR